MGEGLVGGEGFAIDASVIKADANRARGVPGEQEVNWNQGEGPSRAVREYLSALDASNPTDEDEPPAPPGGPSSPPKNISLTDPAARWTAAPGGPAFYAYSTNYLIATSGVLALLPDAQTTIDSWTAASRDSACR